MQTLTKSPFSALLIGVLTAAIVLSGVMLLDRSESSRIQQDSRAEVVSQLSAARAQVEKTLNERLFLVRGLEAFVESNPDFTQEQFDVYASNLMAAQPGIRSLQLNPQAVVTYVYPLAGNEAALGRDMLADPKQSEPIQRAIDEHIFVIAGPIELLQGGVALIGRSPIFLKAADGSEQFWGLAVILIDWDPLAAEAGLAETAASLDLSIRGKDGLGAQGDVFYGDAAVFEADPVITEITLPTGYWQIAATPRGGWQAIGAGFPWIRVGGGLLAVVVGVLAWVLAHAPHRLRIAVQRATADLTVAQDSLKEALKEAQLATATAQEANRLKDLFLATMSHELRTPLNAIIGFLGLMAYSEDLDEDSLHMTERSLANAKRLLGLINSILDLSRITAGRLEITPVKMSPRRMAQTIEQDMALQVGEKGLLLNVRVDESLPETIFHDEERLIQIATNLIGNAIKFTERGVIDLTLKRQTDRLIIEVADTGIGISPAKQAIIFDEFIQVDSSSTRKHGGAGLGLAIVKRLTILMKGHVKVTSELGKGSLFTVDVPLELQPGGAPTVPISSTVPQAV